MEVGGIIASIDEEIAKLKEARALLSGTNGQVSTVRGTRKKHVMSAEAREKIAAAQRKRWAKQKRAAK
jgi:hypothetical protein